MSTKAYYAPKRPPRGSRVSKDTSGRLMNIIAELSVSKNNEDRKRKMQDLKKDFDASDGRLAQLIAGHREQLSVTMESFSSISAKINTSRRGCKEVKEKLLVCKKLLQCKRDEIRRLWSESVEHREVISMLKEIEELNNVHDRFEGFLKEKAFFKATELLVSSLALLDGKLSEADALKDLKGELNNLRKKLHQVLVQELNNHLYNSPADVFLCKTEGKCKSYEDTFTLKESVIRLPAEGSYDFTRDSNYEHIAVILGCISLLNTLPSAVESLKEVCSKELMTIVRNTTDVMCEILQNSSYPCKNEPLFSGNQTQANQPHFLMDLLEAILMQFRHVAVNHYAFLDNLERIAMTKNLTDVSNYFTLADIYSKIQAAVELFIGDYLDLHNTAATQRAAAAFAKVPTKTTDISSYFLRKVTRTKRHSLFKFDGSSHAINKKTYLLEQSMEKREKGELDSVESDQTFLIAQPTAKNITIVYKLIRKFITDVEVALQMDSGTHCPLHSFVMDCVKVFLDQVSIDVNRLIEKTVLCLEAWQSVADVDELKRAGAKTEMLNSTMAMNFCLLDMEKLIYALPDFSSHFLHLICHVLQSYKDLCNNAYKSLICLDSDQSAFSVSWARDKDISRLLRSLPNWTNLEIKDNSEEAHDFEESPEEIRFRNKEESELLIRNLSSKDSISLCEIISDHNKLRNLALMHESMEWFSSQILGFAESLPDVQASVDSLLPEKFNEENDDGNLDIAVGMSTKGTLKKVAGEFQDLAENCLLVLHLEIRAHCFYYVYQLYKQGSYVSRKDDEEPEPEVVKLNADLSKIDESLSPVLQPKKMRYIFEGIGELLSTILINGVDNIKKINENGLKKMGRNIFAVQQNLAGITMSREVALDRARQYFDLLNHTYEDILNQIVEEGPQFQEHEYSAVIQLLHSSREGIYEQDPSSTYLEKLRQILDEVAVSV